MISVFMKGQSIHKATASFTIDRWFMNQLREITNTQDLPIYWNIE